jgi:hypothetical protein
MQLMHIIITMRIIRAKIKQSKDSEMLQVLLILVLVPQTVEALVGFLVAVDPISMFGVFPYSMARLLLTVGVPLTLFCQAFITFAWVDTATTILGSLNFKVRIPKIIQVKWLRVLFGIACIGMIIADILMGLAGLRGDLGTAANKIPSFTYALIIIILSAFGLYYGFTMRREVRDKIGDVEAGEFKSEVFRSKAPSHGMQLKIQNGEVAFDSNPSVSNMPKAASEGSALNKKGDDTFNSDPDSGSSMGSKMRHRNNKIEPEKSTDSDGYVTLTLERTPQHSTAVGSIDAIPPLTSIGESAFSGSSGQVHYRGTAPRNVVQSPKAMKPSLGKSILRETRSVDTVDSASNGTQSLLVDGRLRAASDVSEDGTGTYAFPAGTTPPNSPPLTPKVTAQSSNKQMLTKMGNTFRAATKSVSNVANIITEKTDTLGGVALKKKNSKEKLAHFAKVLLRSSAFIILICILNLINLVTAFGLATRIYSNSYGSYVSIFIGFQACMLLKSFFHVRCLKVIYSL